MRMRNAADKSCMENQNIHFMLNNFFFFFNKNRAFYETLWENVMRAREATDDNIILRTAYWIAKYTDTHLEYVILLASPQQL